MRVSALGGLLYLGVLAVSAVAAAQPAEWAHQLGFTVTNDTGVMLTAHQVAIPIDAIGISSGSPQIGSDLRVASSCKAASFLPHWVEDPPSLNHYVWARADLPPGESAIFVLWGNPQTSNTGDPFAVFNQDLNNKPFSATNQLATGSTGGQTGSQRGFRFTPKDDVVLIELGKREPTGTNRYISLFDVATETLLLQTQVAGPAEMYSYQAVAPRMLKGGTQYAIVMFQAEGDGYYYGSSTQINQYLTYNDMRYCNECTKDSFPKSSLSNTHYGYADFRFLVRGPASPQPTVASGVVETADCNGDGSSARCGDGKRNETAGEECDDGNDADTDTCTDCRNAKCGDGSVQFGVEMCDDGNREDADACLNTCVPAACGDGIVRAGVEECEDGNTNDTDGCRNDCKNARCGDGAVLEGVEQCDDGNDIDSDGCRNTCLLSACGDGVVQVDLEACDDGNQTDADGCKNDCTPARCGDGVTHLGVEQCDDGNDDDGDTCGNDCTLPNCGDGVVQPGEACDDGDANDHDACTSGCALAVCGDGVLRTDVEDCDDHNRVDGDGCSAACEVESAQAPDAGMAGRDAGGAGAAGRPPVRPEDSGEPEEEEEGMRPGTVVEPEVTPEEGCTCRVGRTNPASDATGAAWALLFGLAVWLRRKRFES